MANLADQFATAAIQLNDDLTPLDHIYVVNQIYALVGENHLDSSTDTQLVDLAQALVQVAVQNQKIVDEPSPKAILEAQLMSLATPLPSTVNRKFWNLYAQDSQAATNYFYHLSQTNDYIKTRAIAKNIVFAIKTDYGKLEITINLSKPEKDPKAIAAARLKQSTSYPKCQLCMENECYLGHLGYPARSNHRIVRFTLGGEPWGFQYSPYAYFSEHAIFLDKIHRPMVINQQTFTNLLDIVTEFPHYFVGSDADLSIVGGSMLSHEHYQGGHHTFPMMKAPVVRDFDCGVAGVIAGIVNWPMSDIRLTSHNRVALIQAATKIHALWKNYSDEKVDVRAYTDGVRHHTTTPIVYRHGEDYVLDLVLRDNQTSKQYPDGIFHPHPDVQHIKKENIGLIEVMGRAILPPRLIPEMHEVANYLLGKSNQIAAYHRTWADKLKQQHEFTTANVNDQLNKAIGHVFARVLEDAGVFKKDAEGNAAFNRFIEKIRT